MSRIDELIEELCPEGVPFCRLDELFDVRGGFTPSKSEAKFWSNGTIPWFRMEDIRDGGRILNSAAQMVSSAATKSGGAFEADSIIISTSATIGEHAIITVPFLANQRFSVLTRKREFRDAVDPKYAFYICFKLSEYCKENTSVSSFAGVVMSAFKAFQFPLPPLEIQREIVLILDKFTQLEAELEAELKARIIQYEVTRDALLDFDDDLSSKPLRKRSGLLGSEKVPNRKLGELGVFIRGGSIKKDQLLESGLPAIHYGEIYTTFGASTKLSKSFVTKALFELQPKGEFGDLLITLSDVTPNNVGMATAWLGDGQVALGGDIVVFRHGMDPKYLSYMFRTHSFQAKKRRIVTGGTVRHVSASGLAKIEIPVPPLSVQKEIVDILDKLDALVNDITIGLPAEIAARRKQYEYYRNKLLTFKELAPA